MNQPWYALEEVHSVISPQLLFYPDRIAHNIEEMLRMAGTADRLRPHVKTYKCLEVIRMQMARGIQKFKCATPAEAALLGEANASDALVAYPLIGPAQKLLLDLKQRFPETRFSALVDSEEQLAGWDELGERMDLFIDVNVGMNRTGASMEQCRSLHRRIAASPHHFRGWHGYDGHIHTSDLPTRQREVEAAFAPIASLMKQTGTTDRELICGGSISFPLHASHAERTLSPGTTLLWDHGYAHHFPDLNFAVAAILATRIISKPGPNLLCLDAGHKAIASEMDAASIHFPEMPDAETVTHSEEHLVVNTSKAADLKVGQLMYGIPTHICPTVALHASVGVVKQGKLVQRWSIAARNRIY